MSSSKSSSWTGQKAIAAALLFAFELTGLAVDARAGELVSVERIVAVPDVCAWPNLQLLPNGDLLAFVFNQPCHGAWEGGIDCWASSDGGRTWAKRGVAAPHEPGTNRMNIAAGIAANGDLVVLTSGYPERPKRPDPKAVIKPYSIGVIPSPLSNWVCRSSDRGKIWTHAEMPQPSEIAWVVPFGNMIRSSDGKLTAAFYGKTKADMADPKKQRADTQMFLAHSSDHGKTWKDLRPIKIRPVENQNFTPVINEPALLALDDRRWLCATRGTRGGDPKGGKTVQLYATEDGGENWTYRDTLSEPFQYPSNLLRLADGRLLLTHGSRTGKLQGLRYRVSKDEGKSWSPPQTLLDFQTKVADGGYPASVQLKDGTIVTAYYLGVEAKPQWRYHMGVLRWNVPE